VQEIMGGGSALGSAVPSEEVGPGPG
jgi:hypothetical protein